VTELRRSAAWPLHPLPPLRRRKRRRESAVEQTLQPRASDHLGEEVERLIGELCERKLSAAESCAGGALAALLTDMDSAAHRLERSFVP
jgi:hypothetical protein